MVNLSNTAVSRPFSTFEFSYRFVQQFTQDQNFSHAFLDWVQIKPMFDMCSTSGVFSRQRLLF